MLSVLHTLPTTNHGWPTQPNFARASPVVADCSYISRHRVVCRAAKKASDHTMSILTGRKKTAFSCVHSSMAPSQSTPFLHYSCVPGRVHHTANLIKFATAICKIWVFKILFQFLFLMPYRGYGGFDFFLHTLQKLL